MFHSSSLRTMDSFNQMHKKSQYSQRISDSLPRARHLGEDVRKPPKDAGPLTLFFWRMQLWFECTFGLTVMEPWERMVVLLPCNRLAYSRFPFEMLGYATPGLRVCGHFVIFIVEDGEDPFKLPAQAQAHDFSTTIKPFIVCL
ncbi:hypothetical protein NP233_g6676 [Leucocoprinus birnbaumii]|uniref:Uncharacterized protein n=1 Tax=Leucocoprinus birnbaumii TaxID=56174 RepID=A0AAD5VTY5_9AGAR|nr:hypothetical protein NP233_g6676 [Leucocoprinus birnbaumii]